MPHPDLPQAQQNLQQVRANLAGFLGHWHECNHHLEIVRDQMAQTKDPSKRAEGAYMIGQLELAKQAIEEQLQETDALLQRCVTDVERLTAIDEAACATKH